jgi:hypothetical protein
MGFGRISVAYLTNARCASVICFMHVGVCEIGTVLLLRCWQVIVCVIRASHHAVFMGFGMCVCMYIHAYNIHDTFMHHSQLLPADILKKIISFFPCT